MGNTASTLSRSSAPNALDLHKKPSLFQRSKTSLQFRKKNKSSSSSSNDQYNGYSSSSNSLNSPTSSYNNSNNNNNTRYNNSNLNNSQIVPSRHASMDSSHDDQSSGFSHHSSSSDSNQSKLATLHFDNSTAHSGTSSMPTSTLPEWAYHSRRCDDGRTRHTVENAPYMLPNDLTESDRLDAQHYLVRFVFKGNYNVQLNPESPDLRILDVATGTGVWALEMAHEFPKAEIHGVDISAIFPTEIKPPNCHFQLCNILEGLPFPDNHFDFIYQRLLVYALSPAQRRQVNAELLRVLKPEGFLQLVESDGIVYNPGPQMERINQLSLETSLRHGVDPREVQTMKSGLKHSGYINVNSFNIALPVGGWGGKAGSLSLQNMHGLATIWLKGEVGKMTQDECDAALVVADRECEANKSYYKVWLVVGTKPKEPRKITTTSSSSSVPTMSTATSNTSGKVPVLVSTSSLSSDLPRVHSSSAEKSRSMSAA
ncbi:MAG: S-adenosyl-L-methionine-dependent methyltransferase [Linnemannia gamsii]|nr:MAG: S-adenosyl-L-methionine-dependent methyltransferase [Linnemannia gamsii]